jgi:hypothetical protein
VYDLFSDWDVFNIFDLSLLGDVFSSVSGLRNIFGVGSLNWNLFYIRLLLRNILSLSGVVYLWNIFDLVFHGVVVSVCSGDWDLFNFLYGFVVGVYFLDWNIFSSGDLFVVLIFSLERDILEL